MKSPKYAIVFMLMSVTFLCIVGYIRHLINVQVEENAKAYARNKNMMHLDRSFVINRSAWADVPLRDTDKYECVVDVPYDTQLHTDNTEEGPIEQHKAGEHYLPPKWWPRMRIRISDKCPDYTATFYYGCNWYPWTLQPAKTGGGN